MMKNFYSIGIICLLFIFSCGDDPGEDNGGGQSSGTDGLAFGQISIASSTLAIDDTQGLYLQEVNEDIEDCNINMDIYQTTGTCLTPYSVKGFSRLVTAINSEDNNPDTSEGRIAGITEDIEGEPGAIVSGTEFDLAVDQNFTAYNELWYQYEHKTKYDYITIGVEYQKTTFKVNDSFVTMFVPAFHQPIGDWDVWDECNVPESDREQSRFDDVEGLEDMTFHRGDYLFCVKDSLDATCAATDYQWLNLDSMELVNTRPSNPRVNSYLVNDKPTCTEEGEGRYNLNYTSMILAAKLDSPFTLYADFSHGIDSTQWPEEIGAFGNEPDPENSSEDGFETPYLLYYYMAESDTSTTEGTSLEIDFDFDVTHSVFIDGISQEDLETSSLGLVLSKAFTKHDWVFQKKAENSVIGYSVNHFSSIKVAATVAVTGGRDRPAEPEDTEDE